MRERWFVVVLSVVAAACGGASGSAEPSPHDATTSPSSAVDTSWPSDGEPWDLVVFSDSAGYGVAERFGRVASRDLGVEVRTVDATFGGMSAADALSKLKSYRDLREAISAAEIVVVEGGPLVPGVRWDIHDLCLDSQRGEELPAPYSAEEWQPYRDLLDELFAEIWTLRGGAPTVLLAFDVYNPALGKWRTLGIEDECTQVWRSWADAVRASAEANGATFVDIYEAFNGVALDEDAAEKGLLLPEDVHTSARGQKLFVETLAEAGYEPSTPPGS